MAEILTIPGGFFPDFWTINSITYTANIHYTVCFIGILMMVYYNPYIIIGNPSLIKAYGGMTPSTPPPGTERLVTELVGWQARIWDSAGFFLRQNCLGFLVPFSKGYGLKTSPNMTQLGGGFRFFFHPLFGEDEPILTHIFQMGWNHQLAGMWLKIRCFFLGTF